MQILDRIERKMISDEFTYEFGKFEPYMLETLCGFEADYSKSLNSQAAMYYLQPFFKDYNLEPVLFADSLASSSEILQCFVANNLNMIEIDSEIKLFLPSCYLPRLSNDESVCLQFIREAFGAGK